MPTLNGDGLGTYWPRIGLLVDTCLSNMRRHPIRAFGGVVTVRASRFTPSGSTPVDPVDPTPVGPIIPDDPSLYGYVWGIVGNYPSSVWYSYYDGGYEIPYETAIPTEMFRSTSVTFVDAPLATSVESYAFESCVNLTRVSLPACEVVGQRAFIEAKQLSIVELPTCRVIEPQPFRDCTSLLSINLPECEVVGIFAFEYCFNLTSVSLPKCLSIGTCAFTYTGLRSVELPACTLIGNGVFEHCGGLSEVVLPACSSISSDAFYVCRRLTSVNLASVSAVPTITYAFGSTPIEGFTSWTSGVLGSIYVPASLYSEFLSVSGWQRLSERIVAV